MDLSRVMMNLHSGLYTSPSAFDDDIKLIFSNWKKYNKDPSSMVWPEPVFYKNNYIYFYYIDNIMSNMTYIHKITVWTHDTKFYVIN